MVLTSVESVLDTIGTDTAQRLAGVGASALSNWKARGKLPAELFLVFSAELEKNFTTVDPALFGLKQPTGASA